MAADAFLEMGWVRIVCDKAKKTIYYEQGNHTRPSTEQMCKLKELAQKAGFKLICENTGARRTSTKISKRVASRKLGDSLQD